jgi:NitT/TauT family transport system substrate-binding protein
MLMKKLTTLASVLLVAVGVAAPAFAQEPLKKVTFALGGDGFHMSMVHLAIEGGFMAKEGLEGEIIDVQSNSRQAAAVMGNSVDFAPMGLVQVMKSHAMGGSLEAVAILFKSLDTAMVVSNEAMEKNGITADMSIDDKVKRLAGLRVAITSAGSSTDTFVRTLLKVRGLDADSVISLQPVGSGASMLAAFEAGQVDAFAVSAPHVQVAVQKGLGQIIVSSLKGEVPEMADVPYLVLCTSSEKVKNDGETIRKVVRAMTQAMDFAQKDPAGARAIIRKHFSKIDDALFDEIWSTYSLGLPQSPVISREQMEKAVAWLNITATPPVEVSFDDVAKAGSDIATQAAADVLAQ